MNPVSSTSPRQVKLTKCRIFSPTLHLQAPAGEQQRVKEEGVDIIPYVKSLDIFESIFQNTISGRIDIQETHGLPEYLPLTGTEYVDVEFMIDYLGEERVFRRVFYLRRIINQSFPRNERRVYSIELVTPEYLNSIATRISKRYRDQTCMDAVKDVMRNYLKVPDNQLKSTRFEETSGTIDAVIPNYTPLQAVNYLSLLALTKSSFPESNFVFYETLQGFFFTSIRKLILDGKTLDTNANAIPVFTVNANELTSGTGIDERDAFNSIIHLHQDQLFDIVNDINSGMLRSKMLHLDFFARKWNEEDTRYTQTFDRTTHLGAYPVYPRNFDQRVSRNVKLFIVPTNISTANSSYISQTGDTVTPQRMYEALVLRNRQLNEIQHLRTVLEVPGQPQIRAGAVVRINYPSSRAIDDVHDNPHSGNIPQVPSRYHSGLHLVTYVRHHLSQRSLGVMEYTMHIEAARDSLSAPLIDYKANPSDVDGKAL